MLSPFVALFVANIILKHSLVRVRVILYSLILVVAVGSLAGYSGALSPPGVKPAGIFLVVPLISWVLIALVTLMARALSRWM